MPPPKLYGWNDVGRIRYRIGGRCLSRPALASPGGLPGQWLGSLAETPTVVRPPAARQQVPGKRDLSRAQPHSEASATTTRSCHCAVRSG